MSGEGVITKERKPVIERMFRRSETHGDNRRVITIKYQYDRLNNILKYAATVWKTPKNAHEKYNIKGHLETLDKRYNKHPVIIYNFTDESSTQNFHNKVRKQLFQHGCRAKLTTLQS